MESQQTEDIKIQGDMIDEDRCRFTVSRSVFPAGGSVQYNDREMAKDNPLAEKLFSLDGVTAVLLAGSTVTVSKNGSEPWPVFGKKIGQTIRAYLNEQNRTASAAPVAPKGEETPEETEIRGKVQDVLEKQINPAVRSHGGVVDLLDVKGNTVYIKMGGGCQGCGMASATLKNGIEKAIRETVPQVGDILDITDHASGKNPYYAPSTK